MKIMQVRIYENSKFLNKNAINENYSSSQSIWHPTCIGSEKKFSSKIQQIIYWY